MNERRAGVEQTERAMRAEAQVSDLTARLAASEARETLSANDWAILYRLIDQYTEAAYRDLPADDPSHRTRERLRDRVVQHLVAAREAEATQAPTPGPREP